MCPLCAVHVEHTGQMRSHLGRHLQQLALFTLPGPEMDKNEGEHLPSRAGFKVTGSGDEEDKEESSPSEDEGEERGGGGEAEESDRARLEDRPGEDENESRMGRGGELIMAAGIGIAFTQAIECIKTYSDGIGTVSDMKHYQGILHQFSRGLKVEQCKYDNTFLGLLIELVGPEKARRVRDDPTSAEWDNEDLLSQLKAQMGQTLDSWLGVAKELNGTLRIVCEKFKLPSEKKVPPRPVYTLSIALFTHHVIST